jgi:RNA polymerase sigma-70 factor, ECF subfamily
MRSPRRTKAGDLPLQGALGSLTLTAAYAAYSRLVAHLGIRILGRHDEIDDLVQDVFFEAARWLPRMTNRAVLKQWLITVTIRAARRRRRKRGLLANVGLDDSHEFGEIGDDSAATAQKGALRDVYHVLGRVPADDRRAWTLRYIEGESLARVAQLTGCSLATAKRRIARAQSTVLEALDDSS